MARKKKHGIRNFAFFVLVCFLIAFGIQSTLTRLFPFEYTSYIDRYAKEYHLDRNLVMGVIKTESNFEPRAVSASGAKGLMQLTDATARDCSEKIGMKEFDSDRLFDPETNIRMGCFYLSYLLERFDGELETALAAYNAGEGNVKAWLSDARTSQDGKTLSHIPYPETENYNKKIKFYRNVYEVLERWERLGNKK